jgi:propionyl-CoA synthetase
MSGSYGATYGRWSSDPEGFWAEAADAVWWHRKYESVLDASRPPFYRWFPGGMVNSCYNALDAQVLCGRGEQPALIYDSASTSVARTYTYNQLLGEVARARRRGA